MAADDVPKPDHDMPEADPWADILAESLGDDADRPGGGAGDVGAGEIESGTMTTGEATSADGVTPPDGVDVADGFDDTVAATGAVSTVEIGTGFSGIEFAESDGSSQGSTSSAGLAEAGDLWGVVTDAHDAAVDIAEPLDPPRQPPGAAEDAAHAVVTGAAATARDRTPRRPAGRRLGGIVGILLGAALAIPVVFGILLGLMWLGGPDTLGIRGSLPEALGFLLPPPAAPMVAAAVPGPATAGALSLDDVAEMGARTVVDDPATDSDEPASGEVPSTLVPADPPSAADRPAEPDVAPRATDPLDSREESGDPVLVEPAEVSPTPAPPAFTLDTTALDGAVARATEALAAVAAGDEFASRPAKRRLGDWYRALARVGEELVVLEEAAAAAGHPLATTPQAVVAVHADIAEQPRLADELERLGRMWMEASSRDSDGIVVAGVFAGVRRMGPWWIATLDVANADGTARAVSVVSRSVPAVEAGERVVVTGLLVAGGVVWAGDVRPVTAHNGGRESVTDPFAAPVDAVIPSPGS